MTFFDRLADRVRRGESLPPLVGPALSAASYVQRAGMAWRLRQPVVTVDAYVVSVGNLTTGGAGKTPAVIERARQEITAGKRVAVLTRGYGTPPSREPHVWTHQSGEMDVTVFGDEPALIAAKVPGATIVKHPDRTVSATKAVDMGAEVLVLDDGFQHARLARDENVLLIDASNPFGNGKIVPRGILREPLSAMTRATHIVLTRCDLAGGLADLEETIRQYNPPVPIRRTVHKPTAFRRLDTGETLPLDAFNRQAVAAACAIANPEAFFETLKGLGIQASERHTFRDHAAFDPASIATALPVITTEKDAVRLSRPPQNWYALEIELADYSNSGT